MRTDLPRRAAEPIPPPRRRRWLAAAVVAGVIVGGGVVVDTFSDRSGEARPTVERRVATDATVAEPSSTPAVEVSPRAPSETPTLDSGSAEARRKIRLPRQYDFEEEPESTAQPLLAAAVTVERPRGERVAPAPTTRKPKAQRERPRKAAPPSPSPVPSQRTVTASQTRPGNAQGAPAQRAPGQLKGDGPARGHGQDKSQQCNAPGERRGQGC